MIPQNNSVRVVRGECCWCIYGARLEFQTGVDDWGFRGKARVGANIRQGDVKNLKYSPYVPAF